MVKLTRMFPLLALIGGVAFSVLPAEGHTEIISGKGTGIDPDNPGNTAGVTVSGRHEEDSGAHAFLPACRPRARVFAMVANDTSSDVIPLNERPFIDLRLTSQTPTKCVYEDQEPGPPRINLTVGDFPGPGNEFYFTLVYRRGEYRSVAPFGMRVCPSPTNAPTPTPVRLATSFNLEGGPPGEDIHVFAAPVWLSWGRGNPPDCDYLQFPPRP